MPDDNEIESYWGHRPEREPGVVERNRDQWNPNGSVIHNILTRIFADTPPEYVGQTQNANLIITYLTRQFRATGVYPDYEAVRGAFEALTEPGYVRLLDRVVQGSMYSPTLTSGELWEYLRRRYQNTPTQHIPEIDRSISGYILEYCRENHVYPLISILRGLTISNMRIQERIQELIVQVGGIDGEIPSPSPPPEMELPREEGESPSQLVLDLRRLALLLSDLQGLVDRVGDDEHIDSLITELFIWVEAQGVESNMPERWWEDTIQNFETCYRVHRRSIHAQNTHAHDSTAADRRILTYLEQYMSMVGHLPGQGEIRTFFANQNDGAALTRLTEIANGEAPPFSRRLSAEEVAVLPFGHNTANLELPERRSDEEREYDRRISLRRLALLLDGMTQTSYHMAEPPSIRILRDLQTSLDVLGASSFNPHINPDWRMQTLRDFRLEFLNRGSPGTFPRPPELYPTERRAYPPPIEHGQQRATFQVNPQEPTPLQQNDFSSLTDD